MVLTFAPGGASDRYGAGLQKMLIDGDYGEGNNVVMNYKTQVMTKYMLLERLATALGCASGDKFVRPREDSHEVINTKLQPVIKVVNHWSRAYGVITSHLSHPPPSAQTASSHNIPLSLSPSQASQKKKIQLLLRARENHIQSEYCLIEGNVQLAAYMVQWHATVSIQLKHNASRWLKSTQRNDPFPKDHIDFFQDLEATSNALDMGSVFKTDVASIDDDERKKIFEDLKSCLDLAVHISPLVLLSRVPGKRFTMSRSALTDVSLSAFSISLPMKINNLHFSLVLHSVRSPTTFAQRK